MFTVNVIIILSAINSIYISTLFIDFSDLMSCMVVYRLTIGIYLLHLGLQRKLLSCIFLCHKVEDGDQDLLRLLGRYHKAIIHLSII